MLQKRDFRRVKPFLFEKFPEDKVAGVQSKFRRPQQAPENRSESAKKRVKLERESISRADPRGTQGKIPNLKPNCSKSQSYFEISRAMAKSNYLDVSGNHSQQLFSTNSRPKEISNLIEKMKQNRIDRKRIDLIWNKIVKINLHHEKFENKKNLENRRILKKNSLEQTGKAPSQNLRETLNESNGILWDQID